MIAPITTPGCSSPLPQTESLLSQIPIELVLKTLGCLSAYHLVRFGRTCKLYRQLSLDHTLDIARLEAFKKAKLEPIELSENRWYDFILHNNLLFLTEGKVKSFTLGGFNRSTKKTEVVINKNGLLICELYNHIVVGYFDQSFFLKLFDKEKNVWCDPINLNQYVGASNAEYQGCHENNKYIISINNHTIVLFENRTLLHLPPPAYPDNLKFFNSRVYGNAILRTFYILNTNNILQICYNISTRSQVSRIIINKRVLGNYSPLYASLLTGLFIITVWSGISRASPFYVEVSDHNFNKISSFEVHFKRIYTRFITEYFLCFEDRLVSCLYAKEVGIYALATGRCLRTIYLEDLIDQHGHRLASKDDLIMICHTRALELISLNTGNTIHIFRISVVTPQWICFSERYVLNLSYNHSEDFIQYCQLRIPTDENRKSKPTS